MTNSKNHLIWKLLLLIVAVGFVVRGLVKQPKTGPTDEAAIETKTPTDLTDIPDVPLEPEPVVQIETDEAPDAPLPPTEPVATPEPAAEMPEPEPEPEPELLLQLEIEDDMPEIQEAPSLPEEPEPMEDMLLPTDELTEEPIPEPVVEAPEPVVEPEPAPAVIAEPTPEPVFEPKPAPPALSTNEGSREEKPSIPEKISVPPIAMTTVVAAEEVAPEKEPAPLALPAPSVVTGSANEGSTAEPVTSPKVDNVAAKAVAIAAMPVAAAIVAPDETDPIIEEEPPVTNRTDIALSAIPIIIEKGTTRGRVVLLEDTKTDRMVVNNVPIAVWFIAEDGEESLMYKTRTDEDGMFSLPEMEVGIYRTVVGVTPMLMEVMPRMIRLQGEERAAPKALLILMPKQAI